MRVLFVYSGDQVQSGRKPIRWSAMQFGISYISAFLKAEGHETRLLVLGCNDDWAAVARTIGSTLEEFDPALVCFTAVFTQYAFVARIAAYVKRESPDRFLIVGGPHATLNPDEVIRDAFDAVCIGEGEQPAAELCRTLEAKQAPHAIANLWIKSPDGSIEKNQSRDFLPDLDALPFPDRDMWEPWVEQRPGDELGILLGRGCPYLCTYCSNHALRRVAGGKYVRMRSPENIVQEIASLHARFPCRRIYLEVESVAADKKWAFELLRQMAAFNATVGNEIQYDCNYRISRQAIDEDLFAAFEAANVYKINIGLESGSERVRRDILKRHYTNADFIAVCEMARAHGLQIFVYNMIGVPGETLAEHLETVALNRRVQPDAHMTSIFFPYPGTELHARCVNEGLIPGALDTSMERRRPSLDLPGFTRKEVRRAYTWFHYRVHRGYHPLSKILMQVISTKAASNPTTYLLLRKLVQWPGVRQLRQKAGI